MTARESGEHRPSANNFYISAWCQFFVFELLARLTELRVPPNGVVAPPQSYGVMCFTTLKRACSVPRIPAGRELFCEFTHLGLSSPVAMQSLDLFAKCAYPSHTFSFVCGLVRAVVLLSHVL
jgi:hypothetical protein